MKWRFAIIPLLASAISSFGQTDPAITSQPQGQSAPAGADVTLSVTATGTAPLTYQWWNSAGAILDATNASYSINPAQTNNTDNYFVIVANDYGCGHQCGGRAGDLSAGHHHQPAPGPERARRRRCHLERDRHRHSAADLPVVEQRRGHPGRDQRQLQY